MEAKDGFPRSSSQKAEWIWAGDGKSACFSADRGKGQRSASTLKRAAGFGRQSRIACPQPPQRGGGAF